ncbi:hypothetical protein C8R46DRAFT_917007 [Mycena filopes]|nr:hypothetical protein C8R46DRAFT_917007 [Mycena filopes]
MSQTSQTLSSASGASTAKDHLDTLQRALKVKVPYTAGLHSVKSDELVIYFDVDGEVHPRRIDLGTATEEELEKLAQACVKATFGVDKADVLDETYRKAGKMDLNAFATRLDVVSSGILDAISPDMLEGQGLGSDKVLRAELYKLNVYGPGSFFKAHKDTPRGETMIGSLVVVFPSPHTGGELTLEHAATSWTFDAASKLASSPSSPSVAYIAFYSDVTHAVEPVLTGHRVTLTYNLFLAVRPTTPIAEHRIIPEAERQFEAGLRGLLADPTFVADGGFIAFGLAHQYPIPADAEFQLGHVLSLLKGSDARIRTVCARVGLDTCVKLLYDSGARDYEPLSGHDVVSDTVMNTEWIYDNADYDVRLRDEIEKLGVVLERSEERKRDLRKGSGRRFSSREESVEPMDAPDEVVPVHWVTKITDKNSVPSAYMAYGNDASIEHIYGDAALFVSWPAWGEVLRKAEV